MIRSSTLWPGRYRPKADPFLGAAGVGVRILDQALQLVEFSLHGSPHRRDRYRGGQGAPPKSRPQRACHLLQSPPRPFYGRGYLTRPAMPQTLLSRPQRTAIAPAPVPDPGRSNNSAVQHRGLEQANPRELPIIERAVSAPGRGGHAQQWQGGQPQPVLVISLIRTGTGSTSPRPTAVRLRSTRVTSLSRRDRACAS